MRVKFGNSIYSCLMATYTGNLILIATEVNRSLYTVNCKSEENAKLCFDRLLINGYFEFSEYEYSN